MAADLNHLQKLLTCLADRANKLRAVDPALTRDVELLATVLQQSYCFAVHLGELQVQTRERIRVLASVLLALDQLTSKAFGPVLVEQSRALLEQWVRELPVKPSANKDVRHTN